MTILGPGHGVWPWDVELNDRNFMLGRDPQSNLPLFSVTGQKQVQERLDTGDLVGVYGSPDAEVPEVFSDLSGGFGLSVQNGRYPTMYAYTSDADCRIPGRTMLGFKQTSITLSGAPANVKAMAVMSDGGTQTVFAAAGDQVFKSTNGTSFSLANDFANDEVITDLTVFEGTQGAPFLFVGFDDNKTSPPKFAVYSNAGGWQTESTNTAYAFVVDDNALWRFFHSSGVPKADKSTNGGAGATFGADITLGDAAYGVTNAIYYQNRPYVFQQDTMLQLNDDGDAFKSEVWPGMQNVTDQYNGVGATVFLNRLYMPVAGSVYEYILTGTDQQLTPMGPDLVVSNNSSVRGSITAMVGDRDHWLYGVLKNEDDDSFLIAWDPVHRVWHGSLADLGDTDCRVMMISDKVTTNPTLFIATNRTITTVVLERNGRDRSKDANCTYAASGEVFYPTFHGHLPFIVKQHLATNVRAYQLGANGSALVKYRTSPGASYTSIGTSFETVGQSRIKYPTAGNGVKSQVLDLQVALTGTAGGTVTPIYGDFTHFYAVIPDLKRLFEMWLRVGDSVPTNDGTIDTASYGLLEQHILDTVAAGVVTLTGPSGNQYNVLVRGEPRESQAVYEEGQPYETLYYVLAAEYERLNILGTTGRMEAYTTGDLENFTMAQIEVI